MFGTFGKKLDDYVAFKGSKVTDKDEKVIELNMGFEFSKNDFSSRSSTLTCAVGVRQDLPDK